MDYTNGMDFDDPEISTKDLHPMELPKEYVTSAGRGTHNSSEHSSWSFYANNTNRTPTLGVGRGSIVNSREFTAQEQNKRERTLQEQIQQAMGGSYSNYSIERNFQKAPPIQFENAEPEISKSPCSDLVNMDSTSDADSFVSSYEMARETARSIQDTSSPKKRENQSRKKSTFRKLVITEHNIEPALPNSTGIRPSKKTISDVFKKSHTFDVSSFLNGPSTDPFQLKSKNDFPVLK